MWLRVLLMMLLDWRVIVSMTKEGFMNDVNYTKAEDCEPKKDNK